MLKVAFLLHVEYWGMDYHATLKHAYFSTLSATKLACILRTTTAGSVDESHAHRLSPTYSTPRYVNFDVINSFHEYRYLASIHFNTTVLFHAVVQTSNNLIKKSTTIRPLRICWLGLKLYDAMRDDSLCVVVSYFRCFTLLQKFSICYKRRANFL